MTQISASRFTAVTMLLRKPKEKRREMLDQMINMLTEVSQLTDEEIEAERIFLLNEINEMERRNV